MLINLINTINKIQLTLYYAEDAIKRHPMKNFTN